ncbi:MAG: DUF308 domain-containing protein [Puia sp.]|nr:DUF308 domain-containing protein [Puia sp.]
MKRSKTWWLLSAAGVFFLAIGTYCFICPVNAYLKMVKFSGEALLINGFLLIAASFIHTSNQPGWKKERKWMHAESIVEFLFGILLVFNPILSFIVFPMLIGYCIFCVGIIKIASSLSLKNSLRGWLLVLILGTLLCIFGLLIVYFPFSKANDATFLISAFALIMGSLALIDADRLKNTTDTLTMML